MEYYFPGSETEIRRRDMNTQSSFDMLSLSMFQPMRVICGVWVVCVVF